MHHKNSKQALQITMGVQERGGEERHRVHLVLLYLNIPQYSFFAPFRRICKQLGKHNSCSVELCLPEQTSTARTNNNVVLRSHGPLLSFVVHAIKTDPSTVDARVIKL